MWFKSLNLFSIDGLDVDEDTLGKRLKDNAYVPCKKHEETKSGWVSPLGMDSEYLTPGNNGCHLICLKIETRKVPADTINEELDKLIKELKEKDPEAKITGALKKNLKEEIKNELLPLAFSKYDSIMAYWDTKNNFLVIDVASRTKAETFAEAFKNALTEYSFSVIPVQTQHEPNKVMTQWLTEDASPELIITQSTVSIRDIDDDDGNIKYTKQDLDDERLIGYLEDDKTVSELELKYDDKIYMTVTEDFLIKGVKFSDELKETAENEGNDDHASYMMSAFEVVNRNFKEVIDYLTEECFGGIKVETNDEADEEEE